MASNLIGNEAPLAGVAGSSPVSSVETGLLVGFFVSCSCVLNTSATVYSEINVSVGNSTQYSADDYFS